MKGRITEKGGPDDNYAFMHYDKGILGYNTEMTSFFKKIN
jgi:hypothetical protein